MGSLPTIKFFDYEIFIGEKEFFATCFKGIVNTINPHSYIIARKDNLFHEALRSSDFLLPDGVGIKIGVRILSGRKIKRISGSDLHEVLISSLDRSSGSCFYLGSTTETLDKIKKRMSLEKPSVRVGSYSPLYKSEFSPEEDSMMVKNINEFKPDVLFVGMTAPKQEKWIQKNKNKINVPVICGVGAVFDFYAGTVTRPGKFWIKLGLEWLPRLMREPVRLWRRNFISNPLFIIYVWIEKIKTEILNLGIKLSIKKE